MPIQSCQSAKKNYFAVTKSILKVFSTDWGQRRPAVAKDVYSLFCKKSSKQVAFLPTAASLLQLTGLHFVAHWSLHVSLG